MMSPVPDQNDASPIQASASSSELNSLEDMTDPMDTDEEDSKHNDGGCSGGVLEILWNQPAAKRKRIESNIDPMQRKSVRA
jgi:hypothetical protein